MKLAACVVVMLATVMALPPATAIDPLPDQERLVSVQCPNPDPLIHLLYCELICTWEYDYILANTQQWAAECFG